MEKNNGLSMCKKTKNTIFALSLIMSIGFPVGILFFFFLFSNSSKSFLFTLMAVLGIILVVLGFYVMPIMWVRFAHYSFVQRVVIAVTEEHIYNVKELAGLLNKKEQEIKDVIHFCINKRYITGVKFENGVLENIHRKESSGKTYKCDSCGGMMIREDKELVCPYCGYRKM